MNRSHHSAVHRRIERMCMLFDQRSRENGSALFYDDFTTRNFYRFRAQVSGETVFFPVEENYTDNAGKVHTCKGYIRGAEHQGTAVKEALCPNILLGKGSAAVALYIAESIFERILRSVYADTAVNRMAHTHNAVSALQKGDILKRPHNVISNRGKFAEADLSHSGYSIPVKIEDQSVSAKGIVCRILCKTPCAAV